MKLKEALQVLTAYQGIAGEDAEVEAESFRLESGLDVKYDQYSLGRTEERSRDITYRIVPVLPLKDAQPGTSAPLTPYGLQLQTQAECKHQWQFMVWADTTGNHGSKSCIVCHRYEQW